MAGTTLIFDILAKDRASTVFKAFGREVDNLDKKARGLSHFGDIGGKVALGATAGIAAIVGVTANFEKAMSSVKAATGEGEAGMDALREAAIQAGADTAFSASEAAAGIENLAKAGVATQDILGGGLQGALDLAAAGQIEVAVAAETAASAMTQFGLAGEDVPHIADLLAAAAGKAQGEVTDMAAALSQSGLIADQVGLSIEETTGGLAAFASAGLLGSDAGTSFKTMLGALTPNSVKAKSAMDELGISAYDSQGNFIGLAEFAGKLKDGLSTLTDEQRQATLETIFGSDAVRAAAILYEQGADGIQSWIDKTNDSGFAAEQAATKLDNLAGDFEALKGSLETALIGAGEDSQGPLRQTVQTLTDMVNAFNDLPGPAKNAATGLLAITAVTGGGLWFTSKVVSGIADTRQALADLAVQAPRTGRALSSMLRGGVVLAGLAAIAEATRALTDSFAEAPPKVEELTSALIAADAQDFADKFGGDIADALDLIDTGNLEDLSTAMADAASKGGALGEALFTGLGGSGSIDLRDRINEAAEAFQALDDALVGLVSSGGPERAREAFAALADAEGLSESQRDHLLKQLPAYEEALAGAGNQSALAAEKTRAAGDAAADAGPKFETMSKALKSARSAARGTAREFFGLGDSLDDNKTSLAQWIRDMEKSAAALRNFRKNAETAAKKGLDEGLIASLHEAGPAGALRMKQLSNATEAEIKKANKAWRTGQSEVNKYTDAIGGVPKKVNTDVNVDTGDGLPKIHGLITALSNVRDKTVHITTIFERHNIDLSSEHGGGGNQRTVPRTVPRGPTAERSMLRSAYGDVQSSSGAVGTMYAEPTRRVVVEVRVVGGELDLTKAKVQLDGIAREVARDEIRDERAWLRTQE